MLHIKHHPSPNYNARRGGVKPSMIVLHYTDQVTPQDALDILCDPTREVSAHYVLTEKGEVIQLVDEEQRAWHAGKSYWRGETDINSHSIGIEICNPGHLNGYRPFPDVQIKALIKLCQAIMARWGIAPAHVLGHSDIAPARKRDPGELFPWNRLKAEGMGFWPDEIPDSDEDVYKLCLALGYDPEASAEDIIAAFDRHFRPERINNTGG